LKNGGCNLFGSTGYSRKYGKCLKYGAEDTLKIQKNIVNPQKKKKT
jgi:hypothetical protein